MPFVRIATVDAVNAEVIREALHDAEIAVHLVDVRQFSQLEYLRHQHRAMVDVEVEPEREEDARTILAGLEAEAGDAAMEQAHADEHADKSLDDLRLEEAHRLQPGVDDGPRARRFAVYGGIFFFVVLTVLFVLRQFIRS